jgi:predicted dehydrogenase
VLLAEVDLVSIAVAPSAQPGLAAAAARAGAHVILEKPAAMDAVGCRTLTDELRAAGVRSAVFLSRLWDPARGPWLDTVAAVPWSDLTYDWVSAGMRPGSAGAAGWREKAGPLLDVGPHIVAMLEYIAGPVDSVEAARTDSGGRVLLSLHHHTGAGSTVSIDLRAAVSSTHESIHLRSSTRDESWSNPAAVDFVAAYTAMLDDFLGHLHGTAPESPRAKLSGVQHSPEMAEVLDKVLRRL